MAADGGIFEDGGVAARLSNLMWSLYRYSWQEALKLLLAIDLEPDGVMPPLMRLHLCSAFLELKVVKQGMTGPQEATVEADFDDELGANKKTTKV